MSCISARLAPRHRRLFCTPHRAFCFATLDAVQKKIIQDELRSFRLAGVALDGDEKTRYAAIQQRISELTTKFEENILDEVLECGECERNYKIVKNEFLFYKKHLIPIPRKCFYCRNSERLKLENPFKLWHRKCMQKNCKNEFETSYAPERLEIIYCESCYNKEVY